MASTMLSSSKIWADLDDKTSKVSRSYKIARLVIAGLLVFIAILALVGAWYVERTLSPDLPPYVAELSPTTSVVDSTTTITVSTLTRAYSVSQNYLRTLPNAVYQASVAFGILGIFLAVAVLGVQKKRTSVIVVSLAVVFLAILVAMIVLCFTDGYTIESALSQRRVVTEVTKVSGNTTTTTTLFTTTTSSLDRFGNPFTETEVSTPVVTTIVAAARR